MVMTMSDRQQTLDLIRALSGLNEEYLRVVAAGIRSEGHGHRLREEEQTVRLREEEPVT
jgi:hypothetical protein